MPQPYNLLNKQAITEEETDAFIAFARKSGQLDLLPYNRKSVQRRIGRMLNTYGLRDVSQLISFFSKKSHVRDLLIESFVVHVTALFREPEANKFLVKQVFSQWRHKEHLNIWMAGCSTGEEVISMAIMLKEHNLLARTKLLATDLDKSHLDRPFKMMNLSEDWQAAEQRYQDSGGQLSLDNYFSRFENYHLLQEQLLQNARFQQFDLIQDRMSSKFDLIWCKNVLIYFNTEYQSEIIHRLVETLNPNGFLALGERESLAFYKHRQLFLTPDTRFKLYGLI